MAGTDGLEIELKLRVDDLAALMRICVASGAVPAFTAVQRNEYLDTEARALAAGLYVLRLRAEASPASTTTFLTAKGAATRGDAGALIAVPEEEIVVAGDVAAGLRAGRVDPFALLEAAPDTSPARRRLIDGMRAAAAGAPLGLVGGFTTERTRLAVRFPASEHGAAFDGVLELDRVAFPGDQLHHEVELEVPGGVTVEAARAAFDALFAKAGVTGRPAPGKASRFFRALRGERLD